MINIREIRRIYVPQKNQLYRIDATKIYAYIQCTNLSTNCKIIITNYISIDNRITKHLNSTTIFKLGVYRPVAGTCLVSRNCICLQRVCMCVFVSAPEASSSNWWRDMDPIWLVRQVLQLLYGNYSRYR